MKTDMNRPLPATQKRQEHIEFFRVIIMFLIVLGHFIFHSIRSNPTLGEFHADVLPDMLNYFSLQFLSVFTTTGVNCFVLISGYFLIEKTQFRKGIFKIWFQTIFYSLAIGLILWLTAHDTGTPGQILAALSPFPADKYWFVTHYMGMILLAPFLARLTQGLNRQQFLGLLGILFILLFEFPFGKNFTTGMNLEWFIFLFLTGGYIRKYQIPEYIKRHLSAILLLTAFGFLLLHTLSNGIGYLTHGTPFTIKSTANNGGTFIMSVILFVFFIHRTWHNPLVTATSKLAPYTFGIYLCHEHPAVRKFLWYTLAPEYCFSPLVIAGALSALAVFLTGACIDRVREKLFQWSGINRMIQQLGNKLPQFFK